MNRDKKPEQPVNAAADAEDAASRIGPYNPALGEIYQRLYPEIKRPKPNQEAIAAALQAMQRLTMKMDSEISAEDTAAGVAAAATTRCVSCGHRNRVGNRFCSMCGAASQAEAATASVTDRSPHVEEIIVPEKSQPEPDRAEENALLPPAPQSNVTVPNEAVSHPLIPGEISAPPEAIAPGTHHYHHHYHHHFFPGGGEVANPAAAARTGVPESARETDRLRVAAAAKGEPITRSEAAVRRLTQEWVLACNTRQLDELIELYAPDALVLRSNLPMLRGAAQVREFFFSALESGLGEVALEPLRVEVVGDVAHEVGRYSALVPGTTGKRREERGKYLWVFAKQPGGEWKLISECWSADLTLTNAESDLPRNAAASTSRPARK